MKRRLRKLEKKMLRPVEVKVFSLKPIEKEGNKVTDYIARDLKGNEISKAEHRKLEKDKKKDVIINIVAHGLEFIK